MICVSIGRGRHKQMIAEHRRMAELGAQLVELRCDYVRGELDLKRLLESRPCPVVLTIRRPKDGGRYMGSEQQRQTLLRTGIASGVEYVDLEEDTAKLIPRYGKTKRIISHHDFRQTPENLEEIHDRLAKCDADIVKIATLANTPHDNVRILRLIRDAKLPTVGLCMGEIGQPTRLLCGRFGSPFTYATFHHERELAPGQLSYEQMTKLYDYERIGRETAVYGVIGDPIAHSYSPLIHNAAFHALELDKVYLPFRVPREDLLRFLNEAAELGLAGLSVTIPHKEAVLPALSQIDGATRGIGAANTIIWKDGARLGWNTDYRAAMDAMEEVLQSEVPASATPTAESNSLFAGRACLILGAGGAAKAIAYGLARRGCQVMVSSRSPERALRLAESLGCGSIAWAKRYEVRPEILVNCTPVGMHPDVDDTPFDERFLTSGMLVFDTIYNPEQTLLLKDARGRGCRTISGVEMFIRQAALQFKHFTGQEAPVEVMRKALRRATSPVKVEE